MSNIIYVGSGKTKRLVAWRRNGAVGRLCSCNNNLRSLLKATLSRDTVFLSLDEEIELQMIIKRIENFKSKLVKTRSTNVQIIKFK